MPTSDAIVSKTPVTISSTSTSTTRSAWGGRFQRLLHLELPHSQSWYTRFSLYHQLGHHPILASGNERSKVFFWDLERLELAHTGEYGHRNDETQGYSSGVPRHLREASTASTTSSTSIGVSAIVKKKVKKTKPLDPDSGISDPFHLIKAHKVLEIPKHSTFAFHQCAWSNDGQWCVGVGSTGYDQTYPCFFFI